jgi:16S rRNA (uracil1498-N3)-methyltransferase
MRRFTIAPAGRRGNHVTFDRAESHHLARVLRLKAGDLVVAVDGSGHDYTVRLDEVSAESSGTIVDVAARATESPFPITLVQGVPKGDKMEAILRAVIELGVARVAPAVTARTVVQLDAARAETRRARWERVAREAAKQCGRARLPVIEPARPLAHWLAESVDDGTLRLCLWEDERAPLGEIVDAVSTRPTAALVIVGPEGGLAREEVDAARAAGWHIAGFGPRVLRTETAGPAIVTALQYRFGDLAR